jgi:hypothetical protein
VDIGGYAKLPGTGEPVNHPRDFFHAQVIGTAFTAQEIERWACVNAAADARFLGVH